MHHENKILVFTHKETIFSSHQEEIENNTEITITACQSKEADQQLIHHTLHCVSSCFSYDKIVIYTIDYDGMMILLIAYLLGIPQMNLNVLVYAKTVKSGVYHDIRTMILALDHPTCVAHLFLYVFPSCDTVFSM